MDQVIWTLLFGFGFGLAATIPPGPINTEIARRTLKFGWLPGLAFGLGSIAVENLLALISCMGYGVHLDDHPRLIPILLFVGFMVLTIVGTVAFVNGYRAWENPKTRNASLDDPLVKAPRGIDPSPSADGHEVHTTHPHAAAHPHGGTHPHGSVHPHVHRAEDLEGIRASPALPRTQLASAPGSFFAGFGMAIISPYTIAFWIIALPSAAHHTIDTKHHVGLLLLGILAGTGLWIWGFTTLLSWLKRYSSTWWIVWADLVGGVMLLVFAAFALLKLVQTLLAHRDSPMP